MARETLERFGRSDPIRVGVVGFGKMGVLHSAIVNSLPGVELVAICEKNRLLRRLLNRTGTRVEVVPEAQQLADLDLDAVYVTTPNFSHSAIVKTVLGECIASNVFVEKPLGANYREALDACRLAEKTGGVTMVGYQKRFTATFLKARELLSDGAIGRPTSFNAYAYSSDVLTRKKGWRFRSREGGGALRDLGCHLADLLLWYFGEVTVLSAREERIFSEDCEDYVAFDVETQEGLKGEAEVCWSNADYRLPEVGLLIDGTQGCLCITEDEIELKSGLTHQSRWYRQELNDQVHFLLVQAEYTRESQHFISSIMGRERLGIDFRNAAKVDLMIDMIHRISEVSA